MTTRAVRKLVRDRIPDIIRSGGETPIYYQATGSEYRRRLISKFREESAELQEAFDTAGDTLGELADLWEVLRTLGEVAGHDLDEIERAAAAKAAQRGRFRAGFIWCGNTQGGPR